MAGRHALRCCSCYRLLWRGKLAMLKSKPIPAFNARFAAALNHFGAALLETSAVGHSGIKGTKREDAFRLFLEQRLPKRYGVASGEVVDQLNTVGPQLDVLVFDQTRDFSFSDGAIHILPAEALLVSIEVKSKLNANEVKKSCDAARKLRSLRPFKLALAGIDIGTGNESRILCVTCTVCSPMNRTSWRPHGCNPKPNAFRRIATRASI